MHSKFIRDLAYNIGQYFLKSEEDCKNKINSLSVLALDITTSSQSHTVITIYTARPGMVIGKRGQTIEGITKFLQAEYQEPELKVKIVEKDSLTDLIMAPIYEVEAAKDIPF